MPDNIILYVKRNSLSDDPAQILVSFDFHDVANAPKKIEGTNIPIRELKKWLEELKNMGKLKYKYKEVSVYDTKSKGIGLEIDLGGETVETFLGDIEKISNKSAILKDKGFEALLEQVPDKAAITKLFNISQAVIYGPRALEEKAYEDAYQKAKKEGYEGAISDFVKLNKEVKELSENDISSADIEKLTRSGHSVSVNNYEGSVPSITIDGVLSQNVNFDKDVPFSVYQPEHAPSAEGQNEIDRMIIKHAGRDNALSKRELEKLLADPAFVELMKKEGITEIDISNRTADQNDSITLGKALGSYRTFSALGIKLLDDAVSWVGETYKLQESKGFVHE